MGLVEAPSCPPAASTVFVGRNRRGNWIVREQSGIFGGLFVNRAQAFKYALLENGRHPETIIEVSCEIELDIITNPQVLDMICVTASFVDQQKINSEGLATTQPNSTLETISIARRGPSMRGTEAPHGGRHLNNAPMTARSPFDAARWTR